MLAQTHGFGDLVVEARHAVSQVGVVFGLAGACSETPCPESRDELRLVPRAIDRHGTRRRPARPDPPRRLACRWAILSSLLLGPPRYLRRGST